MVGCDPSVVGQMIFYQGESLRNLLSKKGNDGGGFAISQTAGSGSGSSVMDDSSYMLEKPLMWTISNVKDVGVFVALHVSPSSRDDSPYPSPLDSIE
jgi:hypothetical protein